MRHALVTSIIIACSGVAFAQEGRPQMRWQGYVSDGAVLYIQGKRVDVQGRTTGAIDRPTSRFKSPLPAFSQKVTVKVGRGGGRVEVVEQPSAENGYTAVVDIEPRSPREPEYFDLAFHWNADARNRRTGSDGRGSKPESRR